jgi:hypothetical protein
MTARPEKYIKMWINVLRFSPQRMQSMNAAAHVSRALAWRWN